MVFPPSKMTRHRKTRAGKKAQGPEKLKHARIEDKKPMAQRANLCGANEPSESEPSSSSAPEKMGRSLLSNRILIAWAEKRKRKFAKTSFF
jgi:hypothetical protein